MRGSARGHLTTPARGPPHYTNYRMALQPACPATTPRARHRQGPAKERAERD
jgi:hypothetical protein